MTKYEYTVRTTDGETYSVVGTEFKLSFETLMVLDGETVKAMFAEGQWVFVSVARKLD